MMFPLRELRTSFRPRNVVLILALASTLLSGDALAGVELLESDSRHVLLEITPEEPVVEPVAGEERDYVRLQIGLLGMTEETGRPEVPVGSVRVAVPPGATPRLSVVRQRWSASRPGAVTPVPERVAIREAFRPNQVVERKPREEAIYRASPSYPQERFLLSEVRSLRGLRVASVIYHPVVAEVVSESYRVLESAVVEVTFEEPQGRARTPVTGPAPEDALWERTIRGTVLNAERAAGWARSGPADGSLVGDAPWGGGDQWRIQVETTGLVELTYAALAEERFPAGVPVEQLSVYQRTFDLDNVDDAGTAAPNLFVPLAVPAFVRDRNSDGLFNEGDGLQFYGRSFRDQWMTSGFEHEDKYEELNFVWLRIDSTGGTRMEEVRASGSLSGAPADSLEWTASSVRREENNRYYDHPPDHNPGREAFETEIYYWNDARTPTELETGWHNESPFFVTDPVPGRPASVLVRVAPGGGGRLSVNRRYTNHVEFRINGDLVGERTFYNNSLFIGDYVPPERTLTTHPVLNGVVEGENTFRFDGWSYNGNGTSSPFDFARFFFDWYEVTYDRELMASEDQLTLGTQSGTGNVLAHVRGFGGDDLLLFDVTDPAQPTSVGIDPAQIISAGGGTYDLRFDHDNAGGEAMFVAIRASEVPEVTPERIRRAPVPELLAGGLGVRHVVIAHDDFLEGAEDLADYRDRVTNVSSIAVPLSEVFDVFNNGARHPIAIKNFMTYAYHRWSDPVAFLCLIGDASEDHRGFATFSDPDLLPSHSLFAEYEGAPEDTDQYYGEVTRAAPGEPFDDLVDIYVGRIPVNTLEEAQWHVERIKDYENEDLDAPWRRRVLFLSDDQFSGSLGGGLGTAYGWQPSEGSFESISESLADSLRAHPHDLIIPELVNMSRWSHPLPDSCYNSYCDNCENDLGQDGGTWYECRVPADPCLLGTANWGAEYVCMRERMWQAVLPILRDRLNDGVLMWNFQGHANRFFMTHEEVFKDFSSRNDVEAVLDNPGRPFIFLGFACHLAEFDKFDEGSDLIKDCVSEKMMNLKPFQMERPGGAIAVFASSGFEFLSPNLIFNRHVMDAFFYPEKTDDVGNTLPDAPGAGGVYQWTLGESTTRSRLMFQQSYSTSGNLRQAAQRFVLLGDPALQPRLGTAALEVSVDGAPVEDPSGVFSLEAVDFPDPITVTMTATDGRGIGAVRVRDAGREIDPSQYEVTDLDPSEHGVVQSRTLTHSLQLRPSERYDVNYEIRDAANRWSGFTIRVNEGILKFPDGEPGVYPNPFVNSMSLYYKLNTSADEVRLKIYTINGRKIWEGSGPGGGNVTQVVTWNGEDSSGNPVANGTYILRLTAESSNGTLERTLSAVKMR